MSKRYQVAPPYQFGPFDRLTLNGEEVKVTMNGDTGKVFDVIDGPQRPIIMSNADILVAIGEFQLVVDRNHYDPRRLARLERSPYLRNMPEKKVDKIALQLEWITRIESKRENGRISTDRIRPEICAEYKSDLNLARKNADFKKRNITYEDDQFDLKMPGGRTIRKWEKKYRDADRDWRSLVDRRGTGLRESKFSGEELDIQGRFLQRYLSLSQPTAAYLFKLMKGVERRVNRVRIIDGRATINLGCKSHFYNRIEALPDFAKCVGRKGDLKAMHKYSIVKGVERGTPMYLVEADECRLDLVTILKNADVWKDLSAVEQAAYAEASQRFWCSAVIDHATTCFLSLRLHEQAPSLDTALTCFELTTRDKTEIARDAGCKGHWKHSGGLVMVRVDCATWYTSPRFTATMTDAGVTKMHPPAKLSFLRGTMERVFGTIGSLTLQNYSGRTFSNIVQRGDQDPKKGASVDREMLQKILVRAVVDIHHNCRNTGKLGGMTPNQAWHLGCRQKNPPEPPVGSLKRHIYGVNLKRVIQKDGITVLGFKFQSDEIQKMRRDETGVEVDIRVDLQDLGEITVFEGKHSWTVPSSLKRLRGRSYWHLTSVLHELRLLDTNYTDRTQEDVDAAFEFIDEQAEIGRAMRSLTSPVVTWEHIDRVERRVLRALNIVKETEYTRQVGAQDWRRTPFHDDAWALSDTPEGDDLDTPKSQSKEAIEAKYGPSNPRESAKAKKLKERAVEVSAQPVAEQIPTAVPSADYYDEF